MSCVFHNIPVGTKASVTHSMCMICGETNFHDGLTWTYFGEESPTIHIVNPDTPFTCSGCGHVATRGRVVCKSGNWKSAWKIVAYPISERVSK